MFNFKLGVIGGGNMAEAILLGAIEQSVIAPGQILISEPNEQRQDRFTDHGIKLAEDNREVVAECQYVLLAVKPQIFPKIAEDLAGAGKQTVISIMAGITMDAIRARLSSEVGLVRVMPNTPLLVGAGMSGLSISEKVTEEQSVFCRSLFAAGGEVILVNEDRMDAITAVSGSGPAYLFYLAEHMIKAAEDLGLEAHARLLAAQTLFGAAKLLLQSEDSAEVLREKVTSPGGTTEAAINQMKSDEMGQIIKSAIHSAENRAKQLSSC